MKEPRNHRILTICLFSSFVFTLPAPAGMISITNPSFEDPAQTSSPYYDYGKNDNNATTAITGWTINTSGGGATSGQAGVQNTSQLGILAAVNGSQEGYINGDYTGSGASSIAQQLTTTLQANTTYTLGIYVSTRSSSYLTTGYAIGLYAGGTVVTDSVTPGTPFSPSATLLASATPVTLSSSSWTYLTATYTSGGTVTAGQDLDIVLSVNGINGEFTQLDFDEVTLTAVPEANTLIAAGLLLLPMGASALRIKRKQLAA